MRRPGKKLVEADPSLRSKMRQPNKKIVDAACTRHGLHSKRISTKHISHVQLRSQLRRSNLEHLKASSWSNAHSDSHSLLRWPHRAQETTQTGPLRRTRQDAQPLLVAHVDTGRDGNKAGAAKVNPPERVTPTPNPSCRYKRYAFHLYDRTHQSCHHILLATTILKIGDEERESE